MNFARALGRDLVNKRLWPVAVLLAAALVAVPLLLGGVGGSGDESSVPAAALDEGAAANVSQTAPAVELVGPPSVRSRPGKVRDPFRRPKPKAVKAASASSPAEASKTTVPAATSTSTPQATPAIPTPKPFAYRTEVRFGPTDADAPEVHAISRLTPLGGVTEPALLYLGVSPDGRHAIFLLGPTAQQHGEGRCVDAKGCRIIGLEAGTSTVVDVTPTAGEPRQYSLDVVTVKREEVQSKAAARKARARVHPDGRDVLRDVLGDGATAQALGTIAYAQSLGLLVAKSTVAATSPAGTPAGG
jgi:hypothetical protein